MTSDARTTAAGPAGPAGIDWLALVMGVGFAFMWSSAFTSAKIALIDAPPLALLAVRFWLSGAIAVAVALAIGQRPPHARRDWAAIGFLGICQNSLYLGLFFVAMQTVPAGVAAIIASTLPLVVAVASPLVGGDRLGWRRMAGLLAGFGGAVWIIAPRLGGGGGGGGGGGDEVGAAAGGLDWGGLAICAVGVLALAGATLTVRHARFGAGLLMVVGLQMMAGGAVLTPAALVFEWGAPVDWTWRLAGAFAYIVAIPGLTATLVWFALIRRIGAPRAAAFHFLNPAFGVAVAWAVLGEAFTLHDAAGVGLVALGILLVQWQRRPPAPAPDRRHPRDPA